MFQPKSKKIQQQFSVESEYINQLDKLFEGKVGVYIDFSNLYFSQKKLKWHIDYKRLFDLFKSFENLGTIFLYSGYSETEGSRKFIKDMEDIGYTVITKPVKKIKIPIDATSVSDISPDILKNLVKRELLEKLDVKSVQYLNQKIKQINQQGIYYLEFNKCNFDVEMSIDMMLESTNTDTYVLWSGDSDFVDVINRLVNQNKKVIVFGLSGTIAREINEIRSENVLVFDYKKIKEFICYNKEITINKSQEDPIKGPQAKYN